MPNVASLMAERLSPQLLDAANRVGKAAEGAGVRPYVVGGTVRDLLMGVPTSIDLDVTLLGADQSVFDLIADGTGGCITGRSQFTTASLRLADVSVDLAMTRAEEYPVPGSLPVVRPGTLADDMARRDFSVNAMAVSLSEASFGDLYDPHGGRDDVRDRRLRVLHRFSFRDDATRILRAARYSARLSLEPTNRTRRALLDSVGDLRSISSARVRNELERVFVEGRAASGAVRMLHEWGALSAIHPALQYSAEAWERVHHEFGQESARRQIELSYAVLGATTASADVSGVIHRLLPSSTDARILREASTLSSWTATGLLDRTSPGELAETLDQMHERAVAGSAMTSDDPTRSILERYLIDLRNLRPILTGDDLIALGVPRGPEIGRLLGAIRRAKRDGAVSTRDDERSLALRLISET